MLAVWLSGGDNANATSPLPSLTLLGLSKCGRRPSQCGQPFGARPNAAKKRGLETGRLEESLGATRRRLTVFVSVVGGSAQELVMKDKFKSFVPSLTIGCPRFV